MNDATHIVPWGRNPLYKFFNLKLCFINELCGSTSEGAGKQLTRFLIQTILA